MSTREFSAPHAAPRARFFTGHEDYRDLTNHYWLCDEASATDIIDDGEGLSFDTVIAGGFPDVAGSLWDPASPSTGSRSFDGVDVLRTDTIAEPAWMQGRVTFDAWVVWDTLPVADETIVECAKYEASPSPLGACLFRLTATSAGGINVEHNGLDHTDTFGAYSAGGLLVAGQPHHIMATRRIDEPGSDLVTISIYVDGLLIHRAQTETVNDDGSQASWVVGGSWRLGSSTSNPANRFTGRIGGMRVVFDVLGDDAALDAYARGVRWWDEQQLVTSGSQFKVGQRVIVQDADGADVNLSDSYGRDFVVSTKVRFAVGDSGPSGEVSLRREAFAFALSPHNAGSPFNESSTLLQGNRRIKIQRAVVPATLSDVPYWAWQTRLSGFIGKVAEAADPMLIEVRGEEHALQQQFIINETSYTATATALEDQVQTLIDDYEPGSVLNPAPPSSSRYLGRVGGDTPRVWLRDPVAWDLGPYNQGQMTVWDACRRLVEQPGMIFAAWWDDVFQAYRPAIIEPARTKSDIDITLAPELVVDVPKLEQDTTEIRNKATVRIYDVDAPALADGEAAFVEYAATDSVSIANYGLQACSLGDQSAANIDTGTEAQRLVDACVADNAEPLADSSIILRYDGHLDVEDMLRLEPDGRRWDTNLDLAIIGWEDTVSADTQRIEIDLHAKPVGKPRRLWVVDFIEVITPRRKKVAPPVLTNVVTNALDGAVEIKFAPPIGRLRRQIDRVEIHASITPGFTPSSSSLVGIARHNRFRVEADFDRLGLPLYLRAVPRDMRGNVGPATTEVSVSPRHRGVSLHGKAYRATDASSALTKTASYLGGLTVATDVYGAFSTSALPSTRFTAPVGGRYRFVVHVEAETPDPSNLSDAIVIRLVRDVDGGGVVLAQSPSILEDNEVHAQLVADVDLAAGDEIDIDVRAVNNAADYVSDITVTGDADGRKTWWTYTLLDQEF